LESALGTLQYLCTVWTSKH